MAVPPQRKPRCYRHSVWHTSCPDCQEAHAAEQEAARQRLKEAAK